MTTVLQHNSQLKAIKPKIQNCSYSHVFFFLALAIAYIVFNEMGVIKLYSRVYCCNKRGFMGNKQVSMCTSLCLSFSRLKLRHPKKCL